jgi:hypothetical protein
MTTASQYIWTTTTETPVQIQFISDDLTLAIYNQLLELYAWDLEVELLSEKLKNVNTGNPPIPVRFPWEYPSPNPWNQPVPYYGPPYKVTSLAENNFLYSEDYDAFYDPKENVWTEDKCTDPTCEYCTIRPERPIP